MAQGEGGGRPSIDHRKLQEEVENLWASATQGFFVTPPAGQGLEAVYLPNPPAKKGTSIAKAWAKRAFLELVRHGYSYSAAAKALGYEYKQSWEKWSKEDPEWADIVRAQRTSGGVWNYPDMSNVSFQDFVLRYFGLEFAPHQREIAGALTDPMGRIVQILGFPESGKSTMVILWYVLWRLARDPDIRIAIVSKNQTKAKDLLARVKTYLTERHLYDNKEGNLIDDFNGWRPPHGDAEWSATQIFVRHRRSGERDPSIQALGIGSLIYGTRIDLLIMDDALVQDNQLSETSRHNLDTWFTGEVRSRALHGQIVINGTRLLPFDLYGVWKKRYKGLKYYRLVVIPAILDEHSDTERPSWPQKWSLEGYMGEDPFGDPVYIQGLRDLRSELSDNPQRWKLVYQQEDVEETEAVFQQRHIDAAIELGANYSLGQVFDHEVLILATDPATTGRAAAVLLAFDPETRVRRVVDIFVGYSLGGTGIRNELHFHFWDKYRDHRVQFTAPEINFVPTLMADESFTDRAQAAGTILLDFRTVGRGHQPGNKWDQEYGIAAMASLFGSGLVAFPSRTPEDLERLKPLMEDLLAWPWAEQSDAAIAFWIANTVATAQGRYNKVDQVSAAQRRGVPSIVMQRAGIRQSMQDAQAARRSARR